MMVSGFWFQVSGFRGFQVSEGSRFQRASGFRGLQVSGGFRFQRVSGFRLCPPET
jgi:hypothetical protein